MSVLKKEHHRLIYLFGILLFAASLPLSKYFMSVSQLVLIGNWICEGNFRNKLKRFAGNKAALAACLIIVLHFAGLLWTSDLEYALKDIRIKIPLLVMPFIVASSEELSLKNIYAVLLVHAGAVLAGTLYSAYIMLFTVVTDLRNVSVLISHIRFGMNICFAIFALLWIIYRGELLRSVWARIATAMVVAWFVIYLFVTGSVTGIGIMIAVGIFVALRFIVTQTKLYIKLSVLGMVVIVITGLAFYIRNIVIEFKEADPVRLSELDLNTPRGKAYDFNFTNSQTENGHYIWTYICWEELKASWNKRSGISFDSIDRKGQPIRYTIIRYLTSRDLRKDTDGVNQLGSDDIKAIEDGITNIHYSEKGNFRDRIINLLWEYDNFQLYADPSGQTLMQRVDLWRSSLNMIQAHPWFGVGTGDIKSAFKQQLEIDDSPLKNTGLRSHNQYLAIMISFGITGFLIFLFSLLFPAIAEKKFFSYLYFIFISIVLISMFTEDTLESQPGVSFFAYWNAVLLLGWRSTTVEKNKYQNHEKEKTIAGFLFKRRHEKVRSQEQANDSA